MLARLTVTLKNKLHIFYKLKQNQLITDYFEVKLCFIHNCFFKMRKKQLYLSILNFVKKSTSYNPSDDHCMQINWLQGNSGHKSFGLSPIIIIVSCCISIRFTWMQFINGINKALDPCALVFIIWFFVMYEYNKKTWENDYTQIKS